MPDLMSQGSNLRLEKEDAKLADTPHKIPYT